MGSKGKNIKKSNTGYMREMDERLVNIISTCFIIYMLTVYPLFMHNGYFDITLTKFTLLKVGIIIYGFLMIVAIFMLEMDKLSYKSVKGKKGKTSDTDKKIKHLAIDVCGLMFLISGFLAFLNAPVKSAAYSGINGRRCGLQFLLLMAIMYIMLSYGYRLWKYVFPVFAVVSSFAYFVSILQHLGYDVFRLLAKIKPYQKHMFISTFGNINTFAGFICISLPIFMGLYIFSDMLWQKIIYGVSISLGFAAIIASDSDCAYAGCGAAIIAFLFVAVYNRKKLLYLQTAIWGAIGYTFMALITKISDKIPEKITGFSKISIYVNALAVITIILILLYILCKFADKKLLRHETHINISVQMIIVSVTVVILMAAYVIYGVSHKLDLFTFNDNWGTYRGYIWIRLIELYKSFSLKDKLIGYGNETIASLMTSNYYEEMKSITGTVYDNAHNEYLQYLVTMGLFGAAAFIALMVSSIVTCLRNAKENPVLWALALSIISYGAQAVFNVNQSITTPYVFLFIALAAGIVRYNQRKQVS